MVMRIVEEVEEGAQAHDDVCTPAACQNGDN